MGWMVSPWAQGIGWLVLYGLVYWGAFVLLGVLGERLPAGGLNDAAQIVWLLIPLVAAFVIGVRLHAWWWIAGPPIAIILLQLAYPVFSYVMASPANRQQMGTGLILVSAGIVLSALVAAIAAAIGVWAGKR